MNKGLKYLFVGLAGVSTGMAIFRISQGEIPWLNIFFALFFLSLSVSKKRN